MRCGCLMFFNREYTLGVNHRGCRSEVEFIQGDVANRADLAQALEGMEVVSHLAAYQDYMPDFSRFIHTNAESAALLFELIVSDRKRYPVQKIIFASFTCGNQITREPLRGRD